MRTVKSATSPSWAADLCHPLPLAAVALLAVNDHLLKGSGLLPGWMTGKLSDFAGLFFFPLLLAALARGALRLAGRAGVEPPRALAAGTAALTGTAFALLKLSAPFNAWVAGIWGVNAMDATDLLALTMLPASAAFMLRRAGRVPVRIAPVRGALLRIRDLAAVAAAGAASMATSQAPPPQAAPQPAPTAAVAMAAPETCASLALTVCESSPSETFMVVEATGTGADPCEVEVVQATAGALGAVDKLPSPITVSRGGKATFSLAFLRPASVPGRAEVRLEVQRGPAGGPKPASVEVLTRTCTRR